MDENQKELLKEIREHLAKLHNDWQNYCQNDPEFDGHCKSDEGYVGLLYRMGNWFECESDVEKYKSAKPELSTVEVYSYLFGPHRLHTFDTIEEAHQEVMNW